MKEVIYCRFFDSNRDPVNSRIKVNDNLDDTRQWHPAVGIDDRGNFAVDWEDYRNDNADIYCQYYDANGIKVGDHLRVNDDAGINHQFNPHKKVVFTNFYLAFKRINMYIYNYFFHISGGLDGQDNLHRQPKRWGW